MSKNTVSSKRVESLDSSVILRSLTGDLPEQAILTDQIIEDECTIFFVADVVFFEIIYSLQKIYCWPRKTIATIVASFAGRQNIDCDKNLIYQVLEDYVRHPKLSFADCYLAWKAKVSGVTPLWTLDQKLASQMPSVKLASDFPLSAKSDII